MQAVPASRGTGGARRNSDGVGSQKTEKQRTKKMITQAQVKKIAKATQNECSADGFGRRVVVWADGFYDIAVSDSDVVARRSGISGIESPIARFCAPTSLEDVEQQIDMGLAWQEDEAKQFAWLDRDEEK